METLTLSEISRTDGLDVLRMLWEIGPGEYGFQNPAYKLAENDFPRWLRSHIDMSRGINLDPGFVPMTTYWLRRDEFPIGLSRLRHRLNDALRIRGGHIGFCIRPSERGKGYASILLTKTLEYARKMEIERVLLTCDIQNAPSWRTIERCGGMMEKKEKGERFYWIETKIT